VKAEANSRLQRTEWAELHVEDLLCAPLFREFVFRSPRTLDGTTEHEVSDFLIQHQGQAILISQKCQEDPLKRTAEKVDLWACKNAKAAWRQLRRTLNRPRNRAIWCDHTRRGRVQLPEGLPPILHCIVIVEVFQEVDLSPDADSLPLEYRRAPVTYLGVNDFLNLVAELRTVPEVLNYINAKRALPTAEQRIIGAERDFFQFYLLNAASFAGCVGLSDARITVASQSERLRIALKAKAESDLYSGLLEHVADQLATRDPALERSLPAELLNRFDPADQRSTYLKMQSVLADLRLRERAVLGEAFHNASVRIAAKERGVTFLAATLDSQPDWVYVLGAAKNFERAELVRLIEPVMRGALAHYNKPRCLLIFDRDGQGYEVAIPRAEFKPSLADFEFGERAFGYLRIADKRLELVPHE
jgi:hypothetical protein